MNKPQETKYYEEVLSHFNEPFITAMGEIARCIGYAEDKMDCYIIYKLYDGTVRYHTMVGGYIFLQILEKQNVEISFNGAIWNDLTRIQHLLCPPEKEFLIDIEPAI